MAYVKIQKLYANLYICSFTNKVTLTWDNQRIRSSIAFSPMQSRVVIKSPWKDVSGNYKVTGSRDNFSANALMKWDSDKQIVGDVSFDMTNGVKVEFNAETPFYSKYALYDILFLQESLVRNVFMFL